MKQARNLKSKDELLCIMNDHLIVQQDFAERLKKKAIKYIDDEEEDEGGKKKKNKYLNDYNQQVDAISRTASALIRIQSSSLENAEEESSDSLVD